MLLSKQKHYFKKHQLYFFFFLPPELIQGNFFFKGIYNVADVTEKKVLENEVKSSKWDFFQKKILVDSSPMQIPS